jgi:ABC-type phosphate transport system ATPase subunit
VKYKDYIDINETFQYSINLQFDINNIEKIKSYIPTSDSCEIINCYLDSILGKFSKSTTLIGPYGKGKSHLLLVLLTLLNNYNDEDKESIDLLLKRIKEVSETTYERIKTIRKSNLKYMPVIINSNYNNISQAFLIAMTEALEREKISDIVINTYFDVALKVIEKWEKEGYEDAIAKFEKCLLENNTTIKELKNNLKIC